ncbi:MAG: HAMP domain-containing histidine kinase [Bacteroidetes bacterium]|nr:HAMP domain-containing histidine kinase [Bacteroidota bacterium]
MSSDYTNEIEKDINRLQTITERFSKIGSAPSLTKVNIHEVLKHSVEYIKTRSSDKVIFDLKTRLRKYGLLWNVPLFEWVIENILKNAIDAMSGNGKIDVNITNQHQFVYIDICDTGKEFRNHHTKQFSNLGFTTKSRGWGLGTFFK